MVMQAFSCTEFSIQQNGFLHSKIFKNKFLDPVLKCFPNTLYTSALSFDIYIHEFVETKKTPNINISDL